MLGMSIIQVQKDETSIESITGTCNISIGSYINSVKLRMKSHFAAKWHFILSFAELIIADSVYLKKFS